MTRGGPYDVVSLLAALLGFPARGLAGYMGLPHTELPREIIPPFPTRHHRVQSALWADSSIIDTLHPEVGFRSCGSAWCFTLVDLNLQRHSGITERSIQLPLAGLRGREPDREWWSRGRKGRLCCNPGNRKSGGGGVRQWWGRWRRVQGARVESEKERIFQYNEMKKRWGKGFGKQGRVSEGYGGTRTSKGNAGKERGFISRPSWTEVYSMQSSGLWGGLKELTSRGKQTSNSLIEWGK